MAVANESEFENALRSFSVDQIEAMYRNHQLFADERNQWLREKARVTLKDMISEKGSFGAMLQRGLEELQEGWDALRQGTGKEETGVVWNNVTRIIGGLKIWGAAFEAVGEVAGMNAEQYALSIGASPGLARALNTTVWLATQFVPVGGGVQVAGRTVGAAARAVGVGKVAAKAAGEAAGNAKAVARELDELRAVADSLAIDGVKNADEIVEKAAREMGQTEAADAMKQARESLAKLEELARPKTPTEIQLEMQRGLENVLPDSLRSAKPRYNYRDKTFEPVFESDIDKALYIVAQTKPSRQDAQYMAWLKTVFPGYSEASLRSMGKTIRNEIKEMARKSESGSQLVVRAAERASTIPDTKTVAESFAESVAKHVKASQDLEPAAFQRELRALMQKMGVSQRDLNTMRSTTGRQVMTGQQFYGTLKALEEHGAQLSQLAKVATKEGATAADQAAFMRYATSLLVGTADRPIFTKAFQDLLIHWDPARVAAGDLAGAMKTFAEDMAAMTTRQAQSFLANQDGFWRPGAFSARQAREIWQNFLLPISWPAAFIGNSISIATFVAQRAAAGHPIEAMYMVKGMMLATGDALRAGWYGGFLASPTRNLIGGVPGRIINAQRDTLIAADVMAKEIIRRGMLYADGMREAKRLGISNAGAFVNHFVRVPPTAAWRHAEEFAQRGTFNNDLGRVGSMIANILQEYGQGAGSLYFTFLKSPINLAKFTFHHTPGINLLSRQLYRDLAAGGQRASDAMGRLTLSSLAAMMTFELAKDGHIDGSGPADPAQRAAWVAAGHEQSSVRFGNFRMSLQNIQPLQGMVGFVADIAQIYDQLGDVGAGQAATAAAIAFMHNIANQTAWNQLTRLIDIPNGLARGEKMTTQDWRNLASPLLTIASGGPLGRRIARYNDPVAREGRTLYDMWRANLPIYSETVPPLVDGLGDPVIGPRTPDVPWFGWALPYLYPIVPRLSAIEDNPIKQEAWRLKVHLPRFGDQIGQGELPNDFDVTQAQPGDPIPIGIDGKTRHRWQQIYRNRIYGSGTKENPGIQAGLLDTEVYKTASPAMKREMFTGFVESAKKDAASDLMVERPELMRQKMINEAQRGIIKFPDQAEQIAGEAARGIATFEQQAPDIQQNLMKWGVLEPDKPFTKKDTVNILGVEMGIGGVYTPLDTNLEPIR